MRLKLQSGLAVLLYCFTVAAVLFLGVLWIKGRILETGAAGFGSSAGVYMLGNDELSAISQNGTLLVSSEKLTDMNALEAYFQSRVLSLLPMLLAVGCAVLTGASLGLWGILRYVQGRETMRLAEQLSAAESGSYAALHDPLLAKACAGIQKKFDEHLEDYKRLNSYLSHDQKNAIAILRADFELAGNMEALKSLDRMSDSIDDVLTLSDSGAVTEKTEVDAALVCACACDHYRKLFTDISFEFDEEDNSAIWGRERWLYRAVCNLLDNAVKYGAGKPVQVMVTSLHGSVTVRVRDHGIGIPKDRQDEIFSDRYRVNSLKKDGFGIGLSLVSHVCDLCGGSVLAQTEADGGTSFYISFPEYQAG